MQEELVKGGQGRSAESVSDDASLVVTMLAIALVIIIGWTCLNGCTVADGRVLPTGGETLGK